MPTYKIQFRQDTLSNFDSGNVTLLKGEPAIITDTSTHQKADGTGAFFFIGDGSTAIGSAGGDLKPVGASYVNPAGGANNYAAIDAAVLTGTTTVADLTVQDTDSGDPTVTVKTTVPSEGETVIKHDSITCSGAVTSLGHSITAGELDIASGATLDVNGTSDFAANVNFSNEADLSLQDNSTITTTNGAITTGSGNITTGSGNFTSTSGHVYVPGTVVQVQHYTTATPYLIENLTLNKAGIESTTSTTNLLRTASSSEYVEVTITPKSTNSVMLIEATVFGHGDGNNCLMAIRRTIGGTVTHPGLPSTAGSTRMPGLHVHQIQGQYVSTDFLAGSSTFRYFDTTANTTSAVKYQIVLGARVTNKFAINRTIDDSGVGGDVTFCLRGRTTMTVTEIAGSS